MLLHNEKPILYRGPKIPVQVDCGGTNSITAMAFKFPVCLSMALVLTAAPKAQDPDAYRHLIFRG